MPASKSSRTPARSGAIVGVGGADEELCTCCTPPNPLVKRPDLGVLTDGSAEYALCVLHEPDPMVYRNRGDGVYVQAPKLALNAAGELIDEAGRIIARVAGSEFQRLSTVDDDDPGPAGSSGGSGESSGGAANDRASRPRTTYVDLGQDDFYQP